MIAALALLSTCLLALSPAAILMRRLPSASTAIYGASAAVCIALAVSAGWTLAAGAGASALRVPVGLPWLGAHLRLDPLSAAFLIVLGTGGASAGIYAIGYGRHEREPGRVLPFFPAFLGAMAFVLLADDGFTFLISWEVMSLLSWALVLTDHRSEATRQASQLYLMMAGGGTMALLLAFGLMAGASGQYAFDAIRAAEPGTGTVTAVVVLILLGMGSKAGIYPLHVWLPEAHPAAPSHVSALMSGVMTKIAVYGFVRVAFDLLPAQPLWLGLAVMVIAGVTAVMGVLLALMQNDLKRLLAYSTVENIGIIFIGIGLAMTFRADGAAAAAALALIAAFFHVLNHSLFKSLLFMGAGAVLNATGLRDMDRMGGLIHRMPVTSVVFLAGSVAISALPPFNGFVSEWLTFQAILVSPDLSVLGARIVAPAVGALLALAAALAAACFVKVYGIVFLGRARSDLAAEAHEVDRFSLAAMIALAALCLAAGVLPGLVIDGLAPVMRMLVGEAVPTQWGNPSMTVIPVAAGHSSYSGLLVLVFIAISGGASAWLVHRLASRRLRRGPAWDCGTPDPSPITQYGAGSFAQPIRRVFAPLLGARETVVMPPPGDMAPARHEVRMEELAWSRLYAPFLALIGAATVRFNALQFLTIRRFLSLVFGTLILLLAGLAIWN